MLAKIRHYAYRWQQVYSSWEWPTRCEPIPGINKSLHASSWLFSKQDPRNDTLIPRNSTCRWLNSRDWWTILFQFSVAVLVSTCTVETSSCKKVAKFTHDAIHIIKRFYSDFDNRFRQCPNQWNFNALDWGWELGKLL